MGLHGGARRELDESMASLEVVDLGTPLSSPDPSAALRKLVRAYAPAPPPVAAVVTPPVSRQEEVAKASVPAPQPVAAETTPPVRRLEEVMEEEELVYSGEEELEG